jgi:hypothetical protein
LAGSRFSGGHDEPPNCGRYLCKILLLQAGMLVHVEASIDLDHRGQDAAILAVR